jgi:hypothetical protein
MLFDVEFQHPFEEDERTYDSISNNEVIEIFKNIDWAQINHDVYAKHDDIIHDYYYFTIYYYPEAQIEYMFDIGPEFTFGNDLKENGLKFEISLDRESKKMKKVLFGLLGEKEVIVNENITMQNQNLEFAVKCMYAFISLDFDFLDKNMKDYYVE